LYGLAAVWDDLIFPDESPEQGRIEMSVPDVHLISSETAPRGWLYELRGAHGLTACCLDYIAS